MRSELDSGLKRAGMTSFEYLRDVALIYASKYWDFDRRLPSNAGSSSCNFYLHASGMHRVRSVFEFSAGCNTRGNFSLIHNRAGAGCFGVDRTCRVPESAEMTRK